MIVSWVIPITGVDLPVLTVELDEGRARAVADELQDVPGPRPLPVKSAIISPFACPRRNRKVSLLSPPVRGEAPVVVFG